jgi:hypothetical protein
VHFFFSAKASVQSNFSCGLAFWLQGYRSISYGVDRDRSTARPVPPVCDRLVGAAD